MRIRGKSRNRFLAGAESSAHCEIVHDRKTAIETAIASAAAEDVVLIAGKGHESVQLIGKDAVPFLDAAVARAALDGSASDHAASGRVE